MVEGLEGVLVVVSGKELVAIVGGEEEEDDGDEDEGGNGSAGPVSLVGRLFIHAGAQGGTVTCAGPTWMSSLINRAAGGGCPSRPPSCSP